MKTYRLHFTSGAPARQQGIALFIGLVFLVVLSLVAVIAMQSTLLEMRMTSNVARHEEAFQISESMRTLTGPFMDQNIYTGGWPISWGGTVPDHDFDFSGINSTLLNMFKGAVENSNPADKILYGQLDFGEQSYDPSTWVVDLILTANDPSHSGLELASNMSFVPDGTALNGGAGSAQAAGYRGLGTGAGSGGASRYIEIQSVGLSPSDGSNGRANTIAQYRAVIH